MVFFILYCDGRQDVCSNEKEHGYIKHIGLAFDHICRDVKNGIMPIRGWEISISPVSVIQKQNKKILVFNIDKANFKYMTTRLCFYSVDRKATFLSAK